MVGGRFSFFGKTRFFFRENGLFEKKQQLFRLVWVDIDVGSTDLWWFTDVLRKGVV